MSFIGIVANKKCFENIKNKIIEEIKDKTIDVIQINLRSIENIKNIKFETIIIEDNVEKFRNHQEVLKKLCKDSKYLIMNTDKNPEKEERKNQITYGLNCKATVTVSSISDTDILIYWQKSLKNKEGRKIEIEERRIKKSDYSTLKTYEILIMYSLFQIYNKSIIEEV